MGFYRKVMAVVLVLVMILSLGLSCVAAGSPSDGPESDDLNPGYDERTEIDTNTQDHVNKNVKTKVVSPTSAVVQSVSSNAGERLATVVTFKVARDKDNEQVPITKIGNGVKGVFNSKKGRVVKTVLVTTKAKTLTVARNAFRGSNVKNIKLRNAKKTVIQKDAFKGTKNSNVKIYIQRSKRNASAFTFAKGAFDGLSSKAQVIVDKSTMTAKEFKKLEKKLKAAGFKGRITRK